MSAERERIARAYYECRYRTHGCSPWAVAAPRLVRESYEVADAVLGELGDIYGVAQRLADHMRWFLNAKLPQRGQIFAQAEYLKRADEAGAALAEFDGLLHPIGENACD